tara:strand:+ start:31 stop:810 length:780 start_codon:yes stop_codon:yes gene_type:complete
VGLLDRAFLTIKWGSEFTPDDVNTLKRAAFANTSFKTRFICLTDDRKGLDADIETFPIPEFELYHKTPKKGIWPKISLFHPDISDIAKLVVFLDIDTVVCGCLDEFFDDPHDNLMLLSCGPRWVNMDPLLPPHAATGIMAYRPAFQTHIFRIFYQDIIEFTSQFTVEQEFVGFAAEKVNYFPVQWVESFKYHLRQVHILDLVKPPSMPKPTTKLVAFHGFPRPRDVADRSLAWTRPPRSGFHRPKWIIDYFSSYSDQVV